MRFVQEFRDPALAARLTEEIARALPADRHVKLMEVCGGHTHAIYRHGLQDLLPPDLELVHGPGCPVCVIPAGRVDDAMAIASEPGVTLATFGDMMRVPGGQGSLMEAKARGADVRMVYSPLDALALARRLPDRHVVFFAVGFETTAPATAVTALRARAEGVRNISFFVNHVLIGPALAAILDAPACDLDGFVGPGHVTTVIGTDAYRFVTRDHRRPVVVAGFEPLDILHAVAMLVRQLAEGRCEVENQYGRVVREEGNPRARAAMEAAFEPREEFEWRGLGVLAESAFRLRPELADWDAERRFALPGASVPDHRACRCGDVLRGLIPPWACTVFGTACTPERPLGTCMVSSEGACAAYYAYGRTGRAGDRRPSSTPAS